MSNHESDLISLALVWDVPRLLSSMDAAAGHFVRTLQLVPHEPPPVDSTDSTALGRAASAITLELEGNKEAATASYRLLRAESGPAGVLGAALCAWGPNATPDDLHAYAVQVNELKTTTQQAHGFCQLMTWAKLRGWQDLAEGFYSQAHRLSRGALRDQLESISQNFGGSQKLAWRPIRGRYVTYTWIRDTMDVGNYDAWIEVVKKIARSGRRVITFGGGISNRDLSAAELQAEWAGAFWLLPEIWRIHAAIVLSSESSLSETESALAMWAKGGGSGLENLIEQFEGRFNEDSARNILVDQLHQGATAFSPDGWIEACRALWDEMPEDVAIELVAGLALSLAGRRASPGPGSATYSLFGLLSVVQPETWTTRFIELTSAERMAVVRSIGPAVVARMPAKAAASALDAFRTTSSVLEAEWWDEGWASVAALVKRGGDAESDRTLLASFVPERDYADVIRVCPGVISDEVLRQRMTHILDSLAKEVEDPSRRSFGFGGNSEHEVIALAQQVGLDPEQAAIFRQRIEASHLPLSKRIMSAIALQAALDQGLIGSSQIGGPVSLTTLAPTLSPWDSEIDVRRLRLEQALLNAHFERNNAWITQVMAAAKDPDSGIRTRAVMGIIEAASNPSAVWDAAFLGALYDPAPTVQLAGIRALTKQLFAVDTISNLGWERLRALWEDAGKSVRSEAAALARVSSDPRASSILARAAEDRSLLVRIAARESRE
jgi:hypothetical protein